MSTRWFPAVPGSLPEVRRHVRRLADRSGLDGDEVRHVLVAVGEAVANSVACGNASVVGVTWDSHHQGVRLTVEDDGVFDHGPSGRPTLGMRLLLGVADEVEVRPGRPTWPGTVVRMLVRTWSRPRILLVDDDPATGHELAAALHAEGYDATLTPVVTGDAELVIATREVEHDGPMLRLVKPIDPEEVLREVRRRLP